MRKDFPQTLTEETLSEDKCQNSLIPKQHHTGVWENIRVSTVAAQIIRHARAILPCPCGPCRNCGKQGHHTSICRQLEKKERGTQQTQSDSKPKTQETKKTQRKPTTTNVVPVFTQPPSCKLGQDTVLHSSIRQPKLVNAGKVDLLVGQARIRNHRKSELEEVYMILDTGADRFFITATYAEQLELDETGTSQLKIRTFGSDTPIEKGCTTTCIKIEDRRGNRHNITVAMVDFISGELQRTPVDEADHNYLSQHDISLSIPDHIRTVAPQILIGCGDLFDLFDDEFASTHELPSGLKALHSKIGYLLTGHNRNTTEEPRTQVNNLCTVQSEDQLVQANHSENVCMAVNSPQSELAEIVDLTRHSSIRKAISSFAYALRWLERIIKRTNPDLQARLLENIPELRTHHMDDFISVSDVHYDSSLMLLIRNHQKVHV
ncbi:hypothetical protein RB195_022711 [Necator americanus]|uniref:CCHC-type domain-containing protein n=1 Tax=Necator americanus TaxID=51031 RepID=A0ABR1EHA3_NECAM